MVDLIIQKDGQRIQSVDDWFRMAPPKSKEMHWVDGRSAKEIARAFFPPLAGDTIPPELRGLLAAVAGLGELQSVRLTPECKIRFDGFKGEPRNADLAGVAEYANGRLAVTVESKADESFGPIVAEYLKQKRPARSNVPRRIVSLTQALVFNPDLARVSQLRYQLLHAAAATLAFAGQHQCARALLVIFEFRSRGCRPEKLERNAADLDNFIGAIGGQAQARLPAGVLAGPIVVPGNENIPASVPLYIAKVTRTVA
jgi:hypothetical protein